MIGDHLHPYREILLTDVDVDRWAHRLWRAKAVVQLCCWNKIGYQRL